MPEHADDEQEYAERLAQDADVLKSGWTATIEEMKAMAAEYEEQGWNAYYVASGHTATEPPSVGPEGRFGIVHVIPGNYADDFVKAFEQGEFPEYDVFRQEADGHVFFVTKLVDEDSKNAIFIAGQYELWNAANTVSHAMEVGHIFTHVQKLDGTMLGSFKHDDPAKFFPHAEDFKEHYGAAMGQNQGDVSGRAVSSAEVEGQLREKEEQLNDQLEE
ncbi:MULTISPECIES: hypothetical protein [unclassified Haladaptatus]|uniref:DUF7529 family protein n=1 Tax=unclassified Haladaptatus TaxID=2622732 RepID=UPI0023E773EF|nr:MULTISPECIES: hypothetical protein [unclassified Haladaptatus]